MLLRSLKWVPFYWGNMVKKHLPYKRRIQNHKEEVLNVSYLILDYFWVIFEVKPFWSEDKLLFSGFLGLRGLGRVWSHKTQIMHFKIFGLSDYHKNLLDASFCNGILDDGRKTLSPPSWWRGWVNAFQQFFLKEWAWRNFLDVGGFDRKGVVNFWRGGVQGCYR